MKHPVQNDRVGGRLWFSFLFFGLVGQIAWVVENMYFATFAQDIFAGSGRGDLSYTVTTLMVIFSAITATVTTVLAGGICDRVGRRKPFIAYGYMIWGLTILVFGFFPMRMEGDMLITGAVLLVVLDCAMTMAGSTANDAAFQAFVTDNTHAGNRGKVNGLLSILPVAAVIIIFIGLGSLYQANGENNLLFFLVLGAIPLFAGILALGVLRDAPGVKKGANGRFFPDTLYGFYPTVVRKNRLLYVVLLGVCLLGIAQQTFFSYLINFMTKTLDLGDGFVFPMAIIVLGAAAMTGAFGALADRMGRRPFYYPLLLLVVGGTASMYLLQYTTGTGRLALLYVGGTVMMGGILSLGALLNAAFQDAIPAGYEGRFQGVRMCFAVLIPMIVGPLISLCIGLDAMGMNGADFTPPYAIFLAAALVATLAFLPLFWIHQAEKK